MMACLDQSWSPVFTLIKYKMVVFDELYILFRFNTVQFTADMWSGSALYAYRVAQPITWPLLLCGDHLPPNQICHL
jgi:hypothetical protein